MTWPSVALAAMLALVIVGVLALGAIWYYWSAVGRSGLDLAVKIGAKCVQVPAGAVSLGGAYATGADKPEWLPAAGTGVVCVVLWDVIKELVDARVKVTERAEKEDRVWVEADLRAERDWAAQEAEARTELLTAFRHAADEKVLRLMDAAGNRSVKTTLAAFRKALTPDDHLGRLLLRLLVYFDEQFPDEQSRTRNFRVGLYVSQDGLLTPLRAVDLNNPGKDVFTSYRTHPAAFRLGAEDRPSHVVRCVDRRESIIVEDCVEAETRGEFHFFKENQRSYLRSMVAYYLGPVCGPAGALAEAALVIDTDCPGFFREADRESLKFSLREFGSRLKLELALAATLRQGSRSNEHTNTGEESREAGPAAPDTSSGADPGDAEGRPDAAADHPDEGREEVDGPYG